MSKKEISLCNWLSDVQLKNIAKMKASLEKAYPGAIIKVEADYKFYQEGPDGIYDYIDFEVWNDAQKVWERRFYDFTYDATGKTDYDPEWDKPVIVKRNRKEW